MYTEDYRCNQFCNKALDREKLAWKGAVYELCYDNQMLYLQLPSNTRAGYNIQINVSDIYQIFISNNQW